MTPFSFRAPRTGPTRTYTPLPPRATSIPPPAPRPIPDSPKTPSGHRFVEQAHVRILEEAVLAAYEIITETVPDEPKGLESWYLENLHELVEEIKEKHKP